MYLVLRVDENIPYGGIEDMVAVASPHLVFRVDEDIPDGGIEGMVAGGSGQADEALISLVSAALSWATDAQHERGHQKAVSQCRLHLCCRSLWPTHLHRTGQMQVRQ